MKKIFNSNSLYIISLFLVLLHSSCADPSIAIIPNEIEIEDRAVSSTAINDSCLECTYVVPSGKHIIDGKILKIKPGSTICLNSSTQYKNLLFTNILGTPDSLIKITNCGGPVIINGTGLSFGLKTQNSKFFRITGGSISKSYGIVVEGGHIGLTLDQFSTNFEIDHIEVRNVGFAGIMAKTDPSCDDATVRGNFTMTNVYFHDNFVHDSGGEGFYVGNSFYANGAKTDCGLRLPHDVHNLKLYNNIVKNSGWDGIQVGSATKNARIYGNSVENYGIRNTANQKSGMQLGEGTGGLCYGNLVKSGSGNGMTVIGLGDNVVHDNVIVNAGGFGIFCDERYSPGPGFKFLHNTIIDPAGDGIRIYADLLPENAIINNIIVSPGTYSKYIYPRSSADAYVYKLSKSMHVLQQGNFFTENHDEVRFTDLANANYRLQANSPLVDRGVDITAFKIGTDYYKKTRLKGSGYDIGAAELQY